MDNQGIFTYDSSLPTARDRMRHMLGDTDAANPLRYDESYDAMLTYFENETLATAKMARALASEFAQKFSSVNIQGGPSITYSERVKTWLALADKLEAAVGSSGGVGIGTSYSGTVLRRTIVEESEYGRPLFEDHVWTVD